MTRCEVCGNEYDQCFTVEYRGSRHTFDAFECAIEKLAPHCAHCQIRVIGHGVQKDDTIFCSAHCAGAVGAAGLRDRA
jgi:hypothetical protein